MSGTYPELGCTEMAVGANGTRGNG